MLAETRKKRPPDCKKVPLNWFIVGQAPQYRKRSLFNNPLPLPDPAANAVLDRQILKVDRRWKSTDSGSCAHKQERLTRSVPGNPMRRQPWYRTRRQLRAF